MFRPGSLINRSLLSKKTFYKNSTQINLNQRFLSTNDEITAWREENAVKIIDKNFEYTPITKFSDLENHENASIPEEVINSFKNFEKPSVIQSQAWPILFKKKDLIGVASTGSGKSLAYMVPAVQEVLEKKAKGEDGDPTHPTVLIMVPTRELCQQVRAVTRDLTRDMETFIGVRAAFGGAPRYNQIEKIDQGCDILVGTPGRILDFVNSDVVSLSKVKYFVLDESDRMLDQGFGKDIEEIVSNMPRKRQTTMFSATMKGEKIQELAFGILNKNNCKMVSVGSDGMNLQANADVEQNIIITKKQTKMATFVNLLNEIGHDQKTIIFMGTKKSCDYYSHKLSDAGFFSNAIHGDKNQRDRERSLEEFKRGDSCILLATDVASRGLDIDGVKFVINFDFPMKVDDYVHRIGRTGRAGKKGTAYTFFTEDDADKAEELIGVLERSQQTVPDELRSMVGRGGSSRGGGGYGGKRSSGGYGGNKNRGGGGYGRNDDGYGY